MFHPDAVELARQIEAKSLPIVGGRPFMTYAMRDQFTGQPPYGLIDVLGRHVSGRSGSRPGSPRGGAGD